MLISSSRVSAGGFRPPSPASGIERGRVGDRYIPLLLINRRGIGGVWVMF